MAGLKLLASSRPTFDPGSESLTFTLPSAATKGRLLLMAILSHVDVDMMTPAGWTKLEDLGGATERLTTLARVIGDDEPSSVAVSLDGVSGERQGALLVFESGSPGVVRESSATLAIGAPADELPTPQASVLQAIDLLLAVWFANGSVDIDPPASFTLIDAYSSAVVGARSCAFAYRVAAATGDVDSEAATASDATTGRSYVEVLRDRMPYQPAELVDLVPGNIGLIG